MRFTSEFIVSWVDFGVNPLAVSQSALKMVPACLRFCGETLKKTFGWAQTQDQRGHK